MEISKLYELYLQHPVVTTDTRVCPSGSIFFAMKGANFNGNEFAHDAIKKGCAYSIVDEAKYADGDRVLLVDDCLKTLQQLANLHRKTLGIKVIGITGTNGKTTTKELVSVVLSKKYKTLYTQGNLNNHLGVPLTLLRLRPEHEMAVIEMGANHPGEIEFLVNIVEPDFGLITNVGKAHLEGFGSFEGVKKTKGELYDFLRKNNCKCFLNSDSLDLVEMSKGLVSIPYGADSSNYVSGSVIKANPNISVSVQCFDEKAEISTNLIGTYNLPNILAAICVGRYFDVSLNMCVKAISEYTPTNNRSQLTKTEHNTLIVDAYNANPTSMDAAISNFEAIEAEHKCVILGDMGELGSDSEKEHQKIVDKLKVSGFEQVILVGTRFAKCNHSFVGYNTIEECRNALIKNPIEGKIILVKGSNSMKMFTLPEIL